MDIRKAQPYVFIIFIIGIFIIGLTISILMKPLGLIYNTTVNETEVQEDIYQTFYTRTHTTWIWAPVIIGAGLILWLIIKSNEDPGGL